MVVRLDLGLGLEDPLEDLEESLVLLVHRILGLQVPQDLEVLQGILN